MEKANENAKNVASGSSVAGEVQSSPVRLCFAPGPVQSGSLSAGLPWNCVPAGDVVKKGRPVDFPRPIPRIQQQDILSLPPCLLLLRGWRRRRRWRR